MIGLNKKLVYILGLFFILNQFLVIHHIASHEIDADQVECSICIHGDHQQNLLPVKTEPVISFSIQSGPSSDSETGYQYLQTRPYAVRAPPFCS
ncbi:MAG: hypothetical protein GWO30_08555 [Gammaproteobacteria bacterium]|nr:hypothetical protein [Gammaproteobacteria bacterium]NIP50020.1 hypothetical protein [Gammaproteobacteria bacterium]NIQ20659.1 hypothetical protein [Gammaproteobacteria bacterium]NIQ75077.1 hypothetical protein [Gammaproteobacteria bacterium]NIT06848.1 hypothetical protein [Gammaproteobacteria bacterium]